MDHEAPAFRLGERDDAVTVSALATQVFLDTYAPDGVRPDVAREVLAVCSRDAFAARLSDGGRVFVLAERGDHLLGFAELSLEQSTAPGTDLRGTELVRLYVQPAAQGRHLGRALLRDVEARSRAVAAGVLWLTAWAGNRRALAFYTANGYRDVGSTAYAFEGRSYENRVLVKHWAGPGAA
jgi:GNAT superfamily N-acetyltransferase